MKLDLKLFKNFKYILVLGILIAVFYSLLTDDKKSILFPILGLDNKEILIFLFLFLFLNRILNTFKNIKLSSDRFRNKINLKKSYLDLLYYISSAILSILILYNCIFCFRFNFDITDESYNLYYILNSNEFSNSHTIYYLLNIIWSLTGQKILYLRVIYIFVIITINLHLCYVSIRYITNLHKVNLDFHEKYFLYLSTTIASLFILCREPVLGYHQLGCILVILFSSFCLNYRIKVELNEKHLHLLLCICLISVLAFLIKFPLGIILFLSSYIIIGFSSNKFPSSFIKLSILYFCIILFYYYFNHEYISFYFSKIQNWSTGSHKPLNLVFAYSDQCVLFLRYHIIQPLFAFFLIYILTRNVGLNDFSCLNFTVILQFFISAYISIKFIFGFDYFYIKAFHLNYSFYGVLLSLLIFIIFKNKLFSFNFLILYFLIFISIIQALGTNTIFVHLFSNSLFPIFTFTYIFVVVYLKLSRFIIFCFFLLTCFLAFKVVSYNQFSHFRRNLDHSHQNTYSLHSTLLEDIRIEQDLATTIDSFAVVLDDLNFSFENDRIIPFADLAGIILSVKARSFGYPWIYTNHENTASYFELGIINDLKKNDYRKIYLLQDSSSDYLDMCNNVTGKHFDLSNILINRKFGKFFHHRNHHLSDLVLIGPLIPLE